MFTPYSLKQLAFPNSATDESEKDDDNNNDDYGDYYDPGETYDYKDMGSIFGSPAPNDSNTESGNSSKRRKRSTESKR